jgi:hypothetical protein
MSIPGPWHHPGNVLDGLMLFVTPTTLRKGMEKHESVGVQRPSRDIPILLPMHNATPTRSLFPCFLKRYQSRACVSSGKVTRIQRAQSRSAVKEVSGTWAFNTAKVSCNTTADCHDFTGSRSYSAVIYGVAISNKLTRITYYHWREGCEGTWI